MPNYPPLLIRYWHGKGRKVFLVHCEVGSSHRQQCKPINQQVEKRTLHVGMLQEIVAKPSSHLCPLSDAKSSTPPKASNAVFDGTPVYIADLGGQSTPNLIPEKVDEQTPSLPLKADLSNHSRSVPPHPLSTQRQLRHPADLQGKDIAVLRGHDSDDGIRQDTLYNSSGPAHTDLHFVEPPTIRQTSRSATTTPQMTPTNDLFPAPSQFGTEVALPLKKSFSRRKQRRSREQRREEKDEEEHNLPALPPAVGKVERDNRNHLASELNELAVAHTEGLLGEDEYRMLRQNVFEKMMEKGEMEMPREGRVQDIPRKGNCVMAKEDDVIGFSASTSMRSRRSSTNKLALLFKRESRSELRSDPGSSSLLSANGSIHSGTGASMRSRLSTSATLETQISQARRARTLQSGISVQVVEGSSSFTMGKSGLLSAERGGYSASRTSISSGNALLGGDYMVKSAKEIEAEIAVIEAEGNRILERFKSLQTDTLSRYNPSYEMLNRALEGLGLGADLEAEVFEDYVLIEGGEDTQSNGAQHQNRLSNRIRRKRSIGTKEVQATINGRRGKDRGDSTLAPSSYKIATRQPLPSSFAPPPNTGKSNAHAAEQADLEEPELVNLRAELKEIVRRRSEVAKKYADRLAFLRSTLRSARIRQGLR